MMSDSVDPRHQRLAEAAIQISSATAQPVADVLTSLVASVAAFPASRSDHFIGFTARQWAVIAGLLFVMAAVAVFVLIYGAV